MSETTELIAQQILNGNINKRTWGDILYNVKSWGATGNGTTDDTLAIQATIDYAVSVGGKAVFFPHGTYKVTALTNLASVVLFGDSASFVGLTTPINQIGSATSNLVFNANDYGADPTGSTDSRAAIQAAVDAAVAVYGRVRLRGNYKVSAPIVVNGACSIEGDNEYWNSIKSSSSSNIFTVNAGNVSISGLYLSPIDSFTPTAGSCIEMNFTGILTLKNLYIVGMYNGVTFNQGAEWVMDNVHVVNNLNYGVFVQNTLSPDTGDAVITNCFFNSSINAPGAIRQESSGGLKISNTKILGHQIGFDLQVSDGVNTSILLISNSSIENQTTNHIRLGRKGTTGAYNLIAITGNQFAGLTGTEGFRFTAGPGNITLCDNVMNGPNTATAIYLVSGDIYTIANNNITGWGAGVKIEDAATGVSIGNNNYNGVVSPIEDNSLSTSAGAPLIAQVYKRSTSITSDTVYTNLYKLDLGQFRSFKIQVMIEGLLNGVGVVSRYIEKLPARANAAASVTAISDTNVASVIDVQFDTATTSGSVYLGIRRNTAAGGTSLNLTVSIRIDGHVQKITVL